MLKTEWINAAPCVVPYGTMSAVELSLTDIMDKLVVDDWGQCKGGQFGALRAHVERASSPKRRCMPSRPDRRRAPPGRERDDETILFWHRGLSLSESRWAMRCWTRRSASVSASGCAGRDPVANARMYSVAPGGRFGMAGAARST